MRVLAGGIVLAIALWHGWSALQGFADGLWSLSLSMGWTEPYVAGSSEACW